MADEKASNHCECEHPDHFPQGVESTDLFPKSHMIGEPISAGLYEVATEQGPVRVCRFCRDAGHMARS